MEIRHTTCRSPFFPSNRELNERYIRGQCRLSVVHSWWTRSRGKILNGCRTAGSQASSRKAGEQGGGKKRKDIHATGGAYLNSRLTFIYLATFNFYGRDPGDRLGPAGSSRCVVPETPGAHGAWYNIRGRAAPLN